jgi:NDP-sugar pyrophosphorylase family protein
MGAKMSNIQIVIPMSGFGERFRRAGYKVPKPLIEIDGKPIIAYVIEMFPKETNFLFICNEDHLANNEYRMREILSQYCPSGRVVGIPSHKLGPVNAVLQVEQLIDSDVPVVVNYCDFTCYWNWEHFKSFVFNSQVDGVIPAYKGFHPHSLGSTNYAYIQDDNGSVLDIQEKKPFTENKMDEYASSGTYYFSSGALMKRAFRAAIEADLHVNGEFYVSLAYKPLLEQGLAVSVYPLQHFMQWGTPEDVKEYVEWSRIFFLATEIRSSTNVGGVVVVPMAGLGQRFAQEGYTISKPLIPVSGEPMVVQAACDLPLANSYVFVLRTDMSGYENISALLRVRFPGALIVPVDALTEGQACSASIGVEAFRANGDCIEGPVIFGACDSGAIFDIKKLDEILANSEVDVVVWGARGHSNAARNPHMFGWIEESRGQILKVSVKQPLNDPSNDLIVTGTFLFKRVSDFERVFARMVQRNARVNGEFYLDECVNDAVDAGLVCHVLEVDAFVSWGTPNDLRTFNYWQSCFHKWEAHPYRLEKDRSVPLDRVSVLEAEYSDHAWRSSLGAI